MQKTIFKLCSVAQKNSLAFPDMAKYAFWALLLSLHIMYDLGRLFLSRHITTVVAPWTSSQLFRPSTNVKSILSCLSWGHSPWTENKQASRSVSNNLSVGNCYVWKKYCLTSQWPHDRPIPEAPLRCGQYSSAGYLEVQPCSALSGDGSGLPLQKVLQKNRGHGVQLLDKLLP